jgi:hypothetical protein
MSRTDASGDTALHTAMKEVRWKNLVVLKDGSRRFGERVWSSEKEAKEAADRCVRLLKGLDAQGIPCHIVTRGEDVFPEDYSHTLQVAL